MRVFLAAVLAAFSVPAFAQEDLKLEEGGAPPTVESNKTVYKPSDADLKDVKGRDKRKADRLIDEAVKEKKDGKVWAALTEEEREAALLLLARKVAEVRRQKGWKWVSSVDFKVLLVREDMDKAIQDGQKRELKRGKKVAPIISRTATDPIEQLMEGDAAPDVPLGDKHDLFREGQAVVEEETKGTVALKAEIDEQVKSLEAGDKLLGFSINSAAAPEEGPLPARVTEKVLSEQRGSAAKDFIIKYLKEKHSLELPDVEAVNVHAGVVENGGPFVQVGYVIYREKAVPEPPATAGQPGKKEYVVFTFDTKDLWTPGPRPQGAVGKWLAHQDMKRRIRRAHRIQRRGGNPLKAFE